MSPTRRISLRGRAGLLALVAACFYPSAAAAKPYKGAEVYSQSQHQFGRIEVRLRGAKGGGILSTFFTYKQGSEAPGAAWEEIDVELFGKSNATAWQSNILVGNPRVGSEQVHEAGRSLAEGYHTYTIEWTPTSVVWLVDGVETRRTTGGQANQLTSLHNFRFNLWASDVSSWAGAFDPSVLPQSQYVNWIRYYRYEGGNFVLDWSDDFNSFDAARWAKANWTFDGNLVDFDPNNAVVRDGMLVLCLTAEGQGGCSGAVPPDSSSGGTGGTGGTGSGGMAGSGGAGGRPTTGGAGGMSTAGAGGTPSGGAAGMSTGGTGGAPGTSGSSTSGGASGAGGAGGVPSGQAGGGGVNAAGAQTTAGMPGTSGSASGNTTGGSGGPVVTPSPSGNDSGCGCAVPANSSASHGLLWAACALVLGTRLRRKSHRSLPSRRAS